MLGTAGRPRQRRSQGWSPAKGMEGFGRAFWQSSPSKKSNDGQLRIHPGLFLRDRAGEDFTEDNIAVDDQAGWGSN